MTEFARAERQPYAVRRSIDKLKEEIPIEDYLRTQGVEVKRNRSRCIVHGGYNPQSFSIKPEIKKWRCHACDERGDVVDLCMLVEGHEELWTAIVSLSMRFDVELPKRPDSWHQWQDEKGRRRRMLLEVRTRSYQRWYLRLFGGDLRDIADPGEREEEAGRLYEDLYTLAYLAAEQRMGDADGK